MPPLDSLVDPFYPVKFGLREVALHITQLGDSALKDCLGGVAGLFSIEMAPDVGRINVCEASVIAGSRARADFDLEGAIDSAEEVSAVFLHNADAEVIVAPEPVTLLVWLLLGLTWAGSAWRYQYWHRWRRWEEQGVEGEADLGACRPTDPFSDRAEDLEERSGTQTGGRPAVPWAEHSS